MVHMWGILVGLRLLAVSALVLGMVAVAPAAVAAGEESSADSLADATLQTQTATEEDARGLDVALAASDGRLTDPRDTAPPTAHPSAAGEHAAETPGEPDPEQSATSPPDRTHAAPPSSAPGLAGPASAVNRAPMSGAPSEGSDSDGPIPAHHGPPAAETDTAEDSSEASHDGSTASASTASGPMASPDEGRAQHPSGAPVTAASPTPMSTTLAIPVDEGAPRATSQPSTRAASTTPARAHGITRAAAPEPRAASPSDLIAPSVEHGAPMPADPSDATVAEASRATGVVAAGVIAAGPRVSTAVSVAMDFARLSGGWAGPIVFNLWLRRQMRERRLSQRQLASLSGVDHSTISRLLAGGRSPSLDTAAKLVHALRLDWTEDQVATYFELLPERTLLPTQRVESALRGDPELDDPAVRTLMRQYLSIRQRRPKSGAGRSDRMPRREPPRAATSGTDRQSGP
jgi:transcriptional regulator with XRE-family HTH domain